mgnify:CR=1 FL=1
MEIKIEKNIPVSRNARNQDSKKPLRIALESMEVGDSFLYSSKELKQSLSSMITRIKDQQGKQYVTAHVEDDIRRVWRVS